MKFINMLQENEDSKKFRNNPEILAIIPLERSSRMNDGLIFGDFELSIQCSAGHYCQPRTTLENLEEYSSMELAVFFHGNFTDVSRFEDFDRVDELRNCYEGTVFGRVPVELLNDFVEYMESKTE